MPKPLADESQIRAAALRFLARRDYSFYELFSRLRARLSPRLSNVHVENVLEQLQQQGWLCDQRCAESYIRYKAEAGFGPIRIRQALLMQKRIDSAIVDPILETYQSTWYDRAFHVWDRRFGQALAPRSLQERASQARFLQTRGFLPEHIHTIINTITTDSIEDHDENR